MIFSAINLAANQEIGGQNKKKSLRQRVWILLTQRKVQSQTKDNIRVVDSGIISSNSLEFATKEANLHFYWSNMCKCNV